MPSELRPWSILMLAAGSLFTGGLRPVRVGTRLDLAPPRPPCVRRGLPPIRPKGGSGYAHPPGDQRRRGRRVRLGRRGRVAVARPRRRGAPWW
jgi:hypothetical protein